MNYNKILFLSFLLPVFTSQAQTHSNTKLVGPQADKSVLVPTNQLITPAGKQIYFPGRPEGLNLVGHGQYLLVKNINSLELIRLKDTTVVQSLHFTEGGSSFNGLCTSKNGSLIYTSVAEDGVFVCGFSNNMLKWRKPIRLPKPAIGDNPVPGGLALTQSEKHLLVTLSRNNTLAVVSLTDSSIKEIPVGMVPYGVQVLSPTKAYVSNWGGRRPKPGETTYHSSGSQILVNAQNGVASSGTVSVVDLATSTEAKEIEVGLHPSGMAVSPDGTRLYVACANSDVVSVIDTRTDEVVQQISVHQHKSTLFGSAPNALTVSPDGKLLYVCDGTQNAVCVIELGGANKILGYIPTGWYPGVVLTDSAGGTLYVANIKGMGSRDKKPGKKVYATHDFLGSISIIKKPAVAEFKVMTSTVEKNNAVASRLQSVSDSLDKLKTVCVPHVAGQTSHFKHVVYIVKENRVYDQVFGDLPQGNGDSSLVLFGRQVTPNHHKLAESFVLMDNYYCSGVLSADGHQWADEAYATDYLEKQFGGFERSYPFDGGDAMAYASSGFIWDNVLRHGLTFRDYGEFVNAVITPENVSFTQAYNDFKNGTGAVRIRGEANVEQLKPYVCPTYIGFPNEVPDAYRASEFMKELHRFEQNDSFPNFIVMLLPCDHTSGTSPGTPTTKAALADNDLALGQIVEAISNSKFWKETCIFVTEDDSQDGLDHVDGHRTVGFVISPYTKRNKVISNYYSQISMVRTMENILGLPPMNQLDAASNDMFDCFTETPDFTPYKAEPNNIPLDQLNPPLHALTGKRRYWAIKSMQQNLGNYDEVDEQTFNRIIWHSVKGYNTPYPVLANSGGEGEERRK
jgi:YVTN family beta-propeller protein